MYSVLAAHWPWRFGAPLDETASVQVELVTDGRPDFEEAGAEREAAVRDVTERHAACAELYRKLSAGGATEGTSPSDARGGASMSTSASIVDAVQAAAAAGGGQAEVVVGGGHELRRDRIQGSEPVEAVVGECRSVLLSQGPGAPPAPSLSARLGAAWGVADEAEAEAQLLSYALAAELSVAERMRVSPPRAPPRFDPPCLTRTAPREHRR